MKCSFKILISHYSYSISFSLKCKKTYVIFKPLINSMVLHQTIILWILFWRNLHMYTRYLSIDVYIVDTGNIQRKHTAVSPLPMCFPSTLHLLMFCGCIFQLVIPGDASEMSAFQESASNHTKLYIDFTLPCVSAQLPDKTFFELLYNR